MVKSCRNCRTAKKADFVPCADCDPNAKTVPMEKVTSCSKCRTKLKKDFKQCDKCLAKDQEEVVEEIACFMGCENVEKLYGSTNSKGVKLILCEDCIDKINNVPPQEFQADLDTSEINAYFALVEEEE